MELAIENAGPGSWDMRLRIRMQILSSDFRNQVRKGNLDAGDINQNDERKRIFYHIRRTKYRMDCYIDCGAREHAQYKLSIFISVLSKM